MAVAEVFGIGAIFWFKDLASSKMRKAGLEVEALKTKLEVMQKYNLAMSKGLTTFASGIAPFLTGAAFIATPMLFAASVGKLNETLYMTAKTANASNEQLEKMRKLTFEISNSSIFNTTDIAEGMYEITSAGMDASQAMGLMRGAVSKFAIASGMSIKDSGDMITSAMLAFDIPVSKAMRIADKFIQIQNITKVHFGELKSIIARIAGPAAVMGQSLEQALSWVGMLKQTGVTSSQAGTRYARLVQRLSSRKFAEFAKDIGAPNIGYDKEGKHLPISKTLEQLDAAMTKFGYNEKGKSMATSYLFGRLNYDILERMKKFKFHRVINGKTVEAYGAAAVRKGAENLDTESVGKTEQRSAEMMKLFINQWKRFKNVFVNIVKGIGEIATPQATEMLHHWLENAQALSNWVKEHKKATATILKLTVKIGGLLMILGSLKMALGLVKMAMALPIGIMGKFGMLALQYKSVGRAVRMLGNEEAIATLKANLMGVAIAAVVAGSVIAVTELYLTWRKYRREVEKTNQAIAVEKQTRENANKHLKEKYGIDFKSSVGSAAFTAALNTVSHHKWAKDTTQEEKVNYFLESYKKGIESFAAVKFRGYSKQETARRDAYIDQQMKMMADQPEMIAKAIKDLSINLKIELDSKQVYDGIVEQEHEGAKRAGKEKEEAAPKLSNPFGYGGAVNRYRH